MNDGGGQSVLFVFSFSPFRLYLLVFGGVFFPLLYRGRWAPRPVLLDKTCMFQNRHHRPNRKRSKEEREESISDSSSHRD